MFCLPEIATIWIQSRNGFGETSFERHEIPSRHANKQEMFTDKNGDQKLSSAVLYFESDLPTLSTFVVFRSEASLLPTQDSYEIKALSSTPSAVNTKKAWL